MKHKGKPRPPRIYIDQDGKRYIKLNGKKGSHSVKYKQ